MRRLTICLAFVGILALAVAPVQAALYVDSAPNVYGSSNWAPWWDQAKADVSAGTFVNMRTGTFPGSLTMDPYDEIVYSTGDLGKRLHWIYWLPGETVANLDAGNNFEVKWVIDWAGTDWTTDETGAWTVDGPEAGWSEPSNWTDYNGGVIGSLGFAWWAADDDALPMSTDTNAYNETNQDDIDALRETILTVQTHATGMIRYRVDENSPWQYETLRLEMVPEATTLVVWTVLAGLGATLAWRRRKTA